MSVKDFITNAANSVNEGIQNKINDGTFNRMAAGVGKGFQSLGKGLVSIVSMAEKAFDKIKGEPAPAEQDVVTGAPIEEPVAAPAAPLAQAAPAAEELPKSPDAEKEEQEDGEDNYTPGVEPLDEQIYHLAEEYDLSNDEIIMFGMARLSAITGLFFANCDGNYSDKERAAINDYKEMVFDNLPTYNSEALYDVFEGIDRAYTLDEVVALTRRFFSTLSQDDCKNVFADLNGFARKVMSAEPDQSDTEQQNYAAWFNAINNG